MGNKNAGKIFPIPQNELFPETFGGLFGKERKSNLGHEGWGMFIEWEQFEDRQVLLVGCVRSWVQFL